MGMSGSGNTLYKLMGYQLGEKELSSVREQQANLHMWIGSSQALQFVYQK